MTSTARLGALVERPFRLLWIGRTTSSFGDALMRVTLAFAVLSVGGSATDIGLVLATSTVARVVLLLFGGTLGDRMSRRLLLFGSDAFLVVVQSCVGVYLLIGRPTVTVLLIAAVCHGAAAAVTQPAFTGLVPQTVSGPRLTQANALMDISRSTANILGPLVAGVVIATVSVGWMYLLDAVTFLISAVALGMLKLPPRTPREHAGFFADLLVGWREMTARPWYWLTICGHALWNLTTGAFLVLGPLIVLQQTGDATAWGMITASAAIGALAAGAVSLRWRPRRPLVIAHLGLALTALQLAALIEPSPIPISMAAAALGAGGVTFANTVWTTAIQRLIPENVLSRVSSYNWLVSYAIAPLGFAAVGPLADRTGNAAVLVLAIGCICVAILAVLAIPRIRALQQHRDGKLHGWPELDEPALPAPKTATAR